jgi:hypothetical protein
MDDHRGLFYIKDFGPVIAMPILVQYIKEP